MRKTMVVRAGAVLCVVGLSGAVPAVASSVPETRAESSVFVGDFRTGDFSQWSNVQKKGYNGSAREFRGDDGLRLISRRKGGHPKFPYSAAIKLRDGDIPPFGGGERAEVRAKDAADVREGDERWYRFGLRFSKHFPTPRGDWCIVLQWHSSDGSPPLSINVDNDGMLEVAGQRPENNYQRDIGRIVRGEWTDYTVHVKFSNDRDRGFVEVFQNGRLKVRKFKARTMASDENYLKMGLYRDDEEASTADLWFAGLRVSKP